MWEGSEQSHLSHYKSVFKQIFFCTNSSQPTFICLCKEVFAQCVVFSAHSNEVAALTSPPNGDSAEAKLMCEKGLRRALLFWNATKGRRRWHWAWRLPSVQHCGRGFQQLKEPRSWKSDFYDSEIFFRIYHTSTPTVSQNGERKGESNTSSEQNNKHTKKWTEWRGQGNQHWLGQGNCGHCPDINN